MFPFLLASVIGLNSVLSVNAAENTLKPIVKAELTGSNWKYFNQLQEAGFLLLTPNNEVLETKNAQQFYVPASTTKLITALLALQHWGEAHRFKTEFFIEKDENDQAWLMVKGYGDPFLVSEELDLIAQQLKNKLAQRNITELAGIKLDVSYYQSGLVMPGAGKSNNPYDAIPSALAANFNTIYIEKRGSELLSAEKQTPITQSALKVAKTIKHYKKSKSTLKQRVNLGNDVALQQRYFAELMAEFLKQNSVSVASKVIWKNTSQKTLSGVSAREVDLLYRHYNSKTLADMVKPMMKYSTNFIANQLALNLSVEKQGGQATQDKVKKTYHQLLTSAFKWQDFTIEEGAGLSRNNRLAPSQLIDVLNAFKPWIHLLPEVEQGVYAKSGSLIGVSTLAGYIKKDRQLLPFAMMINQKVPYRFRNKLAKELSQAY